MPRCRPSGNDWMLLIGGVLVGMFFVKLIKQSAQSTPLAENDETWTWTDYKGRERRITVWRKVR